MKTFVPQTGGHPFTLDDVTYVHQAFREVTQDLLAMLSNPDGSSQVIIAGGQVTHLSPTSHTVAAGWLAWNGELIRFSSASLSGTGFLVVAKSTVNIPPSKVYQNGSTVFPYQETKGTVQLTGTMANPSFFYLETARRFGVGQWRGVTFISPDWRGYTPSPTLYQNASYRHLLTGEIELRGHLECGDISAFPTAFVLPEGARPTRVVSFPRTYSNNAGGLLPFWVDIYPNGEVNLSGLATVVGYHASLDGIKFDVRS